MFKNGDVVVCINDSLSFNGADTGLQLGKKYIIEDVINSHVL